MRTVREAVFASYDLVAITSGCGHSAPLEKVMVGPNQYRCPECGLKYHIEQDPPKRYLSGFIMPGNRRIVIDK